jgi:hypothetical protein
MSKRDFYPMFMAALKACFKKETILKAFEATGLSPCEPDVILKRFNLEQALINETLRRKRGKSLPLEQPDEYDGRAVF